VERTSGAWVPVVKALLDNPDGLTRIHGGADHRPVDPEAARRVFEEPSPIPIL
jgi:hypothetical protein